MKEPHCVINCRVQKKLSDTEKFDLFVFLPGSSVTDTPLRVTLSEFASFLDGKAVFRITKQELLDYASLPKADFSFSAIGLTPPSDSQPLI